MDGTFSVLFPNLPCRSHYILEKLGINTGLVSESGRFSVGWLLLSEGRDED